MPSQYTVYRGKVVPQNKLHKLKANHKAARHLVVSEDAVSGGAIVRDLVKPLVQQTVTPTKPHSICPPPPKAPIKTEVIEGGHILGKVRVSKIAKPILKPTVKVGQRNNLRFMPLDD